MPYIAVSPYISPIYPKKGVFGGQVAEKIETPIGGFWREFLYISINSLKPIV
jgi:hypothetical protein